MIEFRYKIIAKIEMVFTLITSLVFFAWILFLMTIPLKIPMIIAIIIVLITTIFSDILTTKFQLSERGLTIKQLLKKEQLIPFDDILDIHIVDRAINEETARLTLYNKNDVFIELGKLKERTLFLELMDSAGIVIGKNNKKALSLL